jgi:hypothetical protein
MSAGKPTWRAWRRHPKPRPDWEARFAAWAEQSADRGHEFGEHDCLIAIADAIEAQTGRDFAEGHRRRYQSLGGSIRYVRALGFPSIAALLDSILPQIPAAFARRGDIICCGDDIPGICMGTDARIWAHGEDRPVLAAMSEWTRAWAVGWTPPEAMRVKGE